MNASVRSALISKDTGAGRTPLMFPHQELSFSIGKFLISPTAKATDAGDFAPSVSIRRGSGCGTLDKIFRFTRRFATHRHAVEYAAREGRALVTSQQH